MKFRFRIFAVISLLLTIFIDQAIAQKAIVDEKQWNAFWIGVPGHANDYEVCLFRKTLDLPAKPATYKVNVSGDNRYKLFVNGQLVSIGPARCRYPRAHVGLARG